MNNELELKVAKLERELEKFKKSYLETSLTCVYFNAILRSILIHLTQIDKNYINVAPAYITLSTKGIEDYIKNNCPKDSHEFCLSFVNNLCKEYLKLFEDLSKVEVSETEKNSTN